MEGTVLEVKRSVYDVPLPSSDNVNKGDVISGMNWRGYETSGEVVKTDKDGIEFMVKFRNSDYFTTLSNKYEDLSKNIAFHRVVEYEDMKGLLLVAAGSDYLGAQNELNQLRISSVIESDDRRFDWSN